MRLSELQEKFALALSGNQDEAILSYVSSGKTLSAQGHFAIYQSSTIGALQNIMKKVYPVCLKLVGDHFFIMMINDFIDKISYFSYDITDFSRFFPDFISNFTPAQSLPYLSDVAKLEYAWHVLEKSGEFSLLSSPYPVHTIWEINHKLDENEQKELVLVNRMYYVIVWQKDFQLRMDELKKEDWQVIELIKK
jgi:hypothetical protein